MAKTSYENFTISAHFELSIRLSDLNITDFDSALKYLQKLPYGRNTAGGSLMKVLDEKHGTCSTKNALLHTLCMENGKQGFDLMMGVYNMTAENMPQLQSVLRKYRLPYLPEAYVFLKYKDTIIDATFPKLQPFLKEITVSEEINPTDIGKYKTDYHKKYLDKWRKESKEKAISKYSLDQLWEIREECMAALTPMVAAA